MLCLPAGLCSQDLVYSVHSYSHNINNCLSSLSVGQAVDAQRLQGGGAASKRNPENQHLYTKNASESMRVATNNQIRLKSEDKRES